MKELLIWVLISAALGIIEAFLFHSFKGINYKFKRKFKFDIHYFFTFVRLLLILPLCFQVNEVVIFVLISMLIFPFFHDGCYYQTRYFLSKGRIYKKGFFSKSKGTSAKISVSFFWRLIFVIFGSGMIFVLI